MFYPVMYDFPARTGLSAAGASCWVHTSMWRHLGGLMPSWATGAWTRQNPCRFAIQSGNTSAGRANEFTFRSSSGIWNGSLPEDTFQALLCEGARLGVQLRQAGCNQSAARICRGNPMPGSPKACRTSRKSCRTAAVSTFTGFPVIPFFISSLASVHLPNTETAFNCWSGVRQPHFRGGHFGYSWISPRSCMIGTYVIYIYNYILYIVYIYIL